MLEVHAILQRQRCNENITKKTGTLSDAYETGIFPGKRGETGNRHRAPLYGDCLYGGFCTRNSCFIIFATVGYKKGKPSN